MSRPEFFSSLPTSPFHKYMKYMNKNVYNCPTLFIYAAVPSRKKFYAYAMPLRAALLRQGCTAIQFENDDDDMIISMKWIYSFLLFIRSNALFRDLVTIFFGLLSW